MPYIYDLKLKLGQLAEKQISFESFQNFSYIHSDSPLIDPYSWITYVLHTYHGSYEWIIMLEKCGRVDLTVFHLIWVIGKYGIWKNQNPGGRFGATS